MDSATRDELRRLEELLLTEEVRNNPARLAQLLTDNFREFGSSGRVFDKGAIIAAIGGEGDVQRSVVDFNADLLSPDVALVTYRLRRAEPSGEQGFSLRSSLWQRTSATGWRLRFHQGTPARKSP